MKCAAYEWEIEYGHVVRDPLATFEGDDPFDTLRQASSYAWHADGDSGVELLDRTFDEWLRRRRPGSEESLDELRHAYWSEIGCLKARRPGIGSY